MLDLMRFLKRKDSLYEFNVSWNVPKNHMKFNIN